MNDDLKKIKPTPEESEWELTNREIIHESKWATFVHDTGKTSSGDDFEYYFLDGEGGAGVVALTEGKLILVNQYRYPLARWTMEIPGGGRKKGQTALDAAKSELLEETGYEAKSLLELGEIDIANGHSNGASKVYFAPDCIKVDDVHLEATEKGSKVKIIPVDEVFEMVQSGKIHDGFTLAALMLAFPHIL